MDPHPRPWHALSPDESFAALGTSAAGLSDAEAAARLKRDGPNALRARPPKSLFAMLKEQCTDPMVLILIGASLLSAFLGEWTEAAVIAAIVALNALIGVVQERKAQTALAALSRLSAPTARVLREGEESVIPAESLVAGDIVFLRDGDRVPADLRLLDAAQLRIEESSLTGESVPAEKDTDALPGATVLADRTDMAYASSTVVYGRGTGLVVATGMGTEVGRIAGLIEEQEETDTPLRRKLTAAGKALTLAGAAVCILIFGAGMFYGRPVHEQLLTAISLAISIIPEGLPAAATILMTLSVQRMARRHALIKKLPAAETLGSASVICSDKTGTLTMNQMTVTEVAVYEDLRAGRCRTAEEAAASGSRTCRALACASALCNDASLDPDRPGHIIGDPTEGALIHFARAFGIAHESLEKEHPRLFEQPFDSDRKRMTTVHEIGGRLRALTKGAADELTALCTSLRTEDGVRPMTDEDRALICRTAEAMSARALRVLRFAERPLSRLPEEGEDVEQGLTFLGLAGMIDPPREEAAEAVRTCREAGIRTVMITGDHPTTARAIAERLGIYTEGSRLLTGAELAEMTDEALDRIVQTVSVFARVSPADKLRIIHSLRRCGEVTAMTGDGVNDAPALKAADIGVAMGISGTDVAKGAADMVLLDDRFATIVHAIREGRRGYRNIQKVIRFLLTGNIAEIATLAAATLLNLPAPLLAVHILCVNLATATLPALALGNDPADADDMKRPPVRASTLFEKPLLRAVILQGLFTAALTTGAYWLGAAVSSHEAGQTMAFSVLAFSQLLGAFSLSSRRPAEGARNLWLPAAAAVSALIMAALLFLPSLQASFRTADLSALQWAAVGGFTLLSALPALAGRLLPRRTAA